MIPDNVTLIVKAPNQQIEDQNIECQSSWTVGQLKGHLSEVYPSKPKTDEQKIIYSGQLLEDKTILKDVLRTYESQIAHTMHLVCTPKRRMPESKPVEQTVTTNEGVRRRNVNEAETPVENTRPEMRQNDQNHTVEMQNYLSSFVNNYGRVPPYPANYNLSQGYLPMANDPTALANHMMMMQQAYAQYMQQYANMWQATAGVPPPAAEAPPQPAPEAPPAVEEAEEQLDWLDHLYAASRLAILLSLVYLYGSPARLLLVLLLAAAGYLHQIGFFRDLHVNPPNANQPVRRPRADNAENRNVGNGNNQVPNNGDRVPNNADSEPNNADRVPNADPVVPNVGDRLPNNAEQILNNAETTRNPIANNNNNEPRQSLLVVTWMVFSSFFASLVPDTN